MKRDTIAIGGSAGSLDALRLMVSALPPDLAGNIFIAVHTGHSGSRLPELLYSVGNLPTRLPSDLEPVKPGQFCVAPTDRHLLVEPGLLRLSRGPREHFTRPAIDPVSLIGGGLWRAGDRRWHGAAVPLSYRP